MSRIGISTGCFYPEQPENAVKLIAKAGCSATEIFINTDSETEMTYCKELKKILDCYGMTAVSLHPFTSFAESYLFFSKYERRFSDGLRIYDNYFELCGVLGAKILNFHGLKSDQYVEPSKYAEIYSFLYKRAASFGVVFSQENVRHHVCGDPSYCKSVRNELNGEISFTLDLKQAHIQGFDPNEFIDVFSDRLSLVHINDFNNDNCCLLPFEGSFDIRSFILRLNSESYDGDYIIEVYSHNYSQQSDIKNSYTKLTKLFL